MRTLMLCFVLLCPVLSLVDEARNATFTFPAVIYFGDSIVDTGNNNGLTTIVKVNYPPYGENFIGGRPTGRFSNGKVPSDLTVEELGVKGLLPAYLDPTLQAEELLTGVNFASGGAGYDPLTSKIVNVLSLSDQIEMFKEYKEKLEQIIGYDRTSELLSETLFMLVTGSNDFTNTYFGIPHRKSQYDVASYADILVGYASAFVKELFGLGARKVGVYGLPPLGCLPFVRTLEGGAERKCVKIFNQAAKLFNKKLINEIKSINAQYSTGRVAYIDAYTLPHNLIHHPHKFGFKVSDKGCCGMGTIEVAFLCKYTCQDVLEHVFWDNFHLTERAYRLLVHEMIETSIQSLVI